MHGQQNIERNKLLQLNIQSTSLVGILLQTLIFAYIFKKIVHRL